MNSEFEPSIEWVHEDNGDTLLLYLPGFKKENLRVQLRSRTLIISGRRILQDNRLSQFQKEFPVAKHSDVNKISAKFEGSILYVKLPNSNTPMAKQQEKPPTATPAPAPENPIDEPKENPEKAQLKPDSKPTSISQPNGKYDVGKTEKDDPEKDVKEKDGNGEEKVAELKEPKGVCENASKKKLKPSRNDVIKIVVLVIGFVVGVYLTKSFQSWITGEHSNPLV